MKTNETVFDTIKPTVRLSISNANNGSHSEFGRGVAQLCLGVQELGSLNAAAKSMGMAYSKAWRIVKDTEATLGFALLNRDGAHGSELTPEGAKLIAAYSKLEAKLQKDADTQLAKLLAK